MAGKEQEQLSVLGTNILKKIHHYELACGIGAATGLILKLCGLIQVGIPVITISLGIMSVIYFFSAYAIVETKNVSKKEVFFTKLIALASAVTVVGILFALQNWPGYPQQMIIGLTALALGTFLVFRSKGDKPELALFDRRLGIRVVVLLIIASIILVVKVRTLS